MELPGRRALRSGKHFDTQVVDKCRAVAREGNKDLEWATGRDSPVELQWLPPLSFSYAEAHGKTTEGIGYQQSVDAGLNRLGHSDPKADSAPSRPAGSATGGVTIHAGEFQKSRGGNLPPEVSRRFLTRSDLGRQLAAIAGLWR